MNISLLLSFLWIPAVRGFYVVSSYSIPTQYSNVLPINRLLSSSSSSQKVTRQRQRQYPIFTMNDDNNSNVVYQQVKTMDPIIECFLLITDEQLNSDDHQEVVMTTDESARIVCTSEPEEYAWFHGLSPQQMQKMTDGIRDNGRDKLQCVEGASPRGIPEWECQ
jgi:hypothetical protein